ncbi:FadR/GntR family transcriptional regulator [Nakamurella lactea]|uniref:FadR/GntR family transcriptional regulator n=1 Tax=Nakamurella lactea TaxID=459515 RepID=UPI0004273C40|nr:FadR/GntR family transcriptional regulator [Nakamurella lactea]
MAARSDRHRFDAQEEIKSVILKRKLPPGAPIPTETELMEELGISRGSLREALKGLQARGIVDVQHGRGMFVGALSMDSLVDGLIFHGRLDRSRNDLTTAAELVAVRDVLESGLVAQVAADPDEQLLADLDTCVDDMERAVAAGESFQDADRDFHLLLYSRMGNSLVQQLVQAFWTVLDGVRPQLASGISAPEDDVAHHRRIVERLRARDPDGARAAMTEHFRGTHAWIRTGLGADAATATGTPATDR